MSHRRTAVPLLLLLVVGACLVASAAAMSCMSDAGRPVSWFAMLKYPKGGSYVYADVDSPTFKVSPGGDVGSKTAGAMAKTIGQVYSGSVGYILYNDEPAAGAKKKHHAASAMSEFSALHSALNMTAVEFGHSKGVVGWKAGAGFWLVHSFPKFPSMVSAGYDGVPTGEQIYGQSILCVSTNAAGLAVVGSQLQLNHPEVYDSNTPSGTPQTLSDAAAGKFDSTATALGKKLVASDGTVFTSFSKTGAWGKALYGDLVAPSLRAPLLAETWIRGSKIPSSCPSSGFGVKNVVALTFPPHVQFAESADHSKWAITADKSARTVCIGGINQMTTQNVRGGGTVCIANADLWQSLMGFVSSVEPC